MIGKILIRVKCGMEEVYCCFPFVRDQKSIIASLLE